MCYKGRGRPKVQLTAELGNVPLGGGVTALSASLCLQGSRTPSPQNTKTPLNFTKPSHMVNAGAAANGSNTPVPGRALPPAPPITPLVSPWQYNLKVAGKLHLNGVGPAVEFAGQVGEDRTFWVDLARVPVVPHIELEAVKMTWDSLEDKDVAMNCSVVIYGQAAGNKRFTAVGSLDSSAGTWSVEASIRCTGSL